MADPIVAGRRHRRGRDEVRPAHARRMHRAGQEIPRRRITQRRTSADGCHGRKAHRNPRLPRHHLVAEPTIAAARPQPAHSHHRTQPARRNDQGTPRNRHRDLQRTTRVP